MQRPLLSTDPGARVHEGAFYEMGFEHLQRLKQAGYSKVGVGIALLNGAGEILLAEHRPSAKVGPAVNGITSETLGGHPKNGHVVAEKTVQAIGRCLYEELDIDPENADLMTRTSNHFSLSDWPIPSGKLLAVNVALLMDDRTAEAAVSVSNTPEVVSARFVRPEQVMRGAIDRLRPGTADCLKSLDDYSLLDPIELADARLVLPRLVVPDFDLDLSKIDG